MSVMTDGEFRRGSYWARFVERTQGFDDPAGGIQLSRRSRPRSRIHRALRRAASYAARQPLALDEFLFLRGLAEAAASPKITLPAPSTMHFYRCSDYAEKVVYADVHGFLCRSWPKCFATRLPILRRPAAAMFSSTRLRSRCCAIRRSAVRSSAQGEDPDKTGRSLYRGDQCGGGGRTRRTWWSACICAAAISRATTSAAGGYEAVAERFFNNTKVNHFLLEYDTAARRRFRAAAIRAEGQGRGAGARQQQDAGARKPRRAEAPDRGGDEVTSICDRLAISPQCGFAVDGRRQSGERGRRVRRSSRAWSKQRARSGAIRSLMERSRLGSI